jgi:aminocarboxymuconate-semialdehyde decarboxylase
LLTEVMGVDNVMQGSDYPFPLGEQDVGGLVRGVDFLSEAQKGRILRDNAVAFFNLA